MLTQCPECELPVSDKATACPHCGYPMKPSEKQKKPRKSNKRRRLPNGFGQISEIKNRNLRNPFRAMVTVGKTPDGKPICKPLKPESYFATYNDAYAALVEYNKNPYDLEPSITMQELYDKWLPEYEKTVKSTKSATSAWAYCSGVYKMRVMDIRARHVKGCMEEGVAVIRGKEQHPTATMKNQIKSLFNLMLDYALEYELVDRNYSRTFNLTEETVKEIQSVKKEHIAFADEEMDLLWANITNKRGIDILLIQCYSGWRPQELGLLELKDVDLENWTFQGGMKTDASENRIVPIHSRIQDLVLQKYQEAEALGSPYLLNWADTNNRNRKNLKLTYARYQKAFERIRDELKLNPNHRPHDGRTHFVTMAKRYGVDEYAIKYMVGHKISDITEKVYTRREFAWLREEIEKIK
ncbi:tyrosine-type recombinase/integrase [Flavonifractor sp. DFI.6.63]|uniref:tyrosine-type recombinase/integrase n=2 Tax=Flavonifractor TaxID=946234 RepID=UPI00189BF266|nr:MULTISPECIES: tyrosine-type recombinase/integrase [Flavonifractor]MCG4705106.1 tyrosine-type recombinase/integrase [Flavonifractor plautii]MCQ5029283.1 tyrosine-type recombinase/integrase [Flavonifractor sp. DFI.6.63]UBS61707.1 tyrosine-type recombinase/integrase [Flavonifractor plautii]